MTGLSAHADSVCAGILTAAEHRGRYNGHVFTQGTLMDRRDRLIQFWRYLKVPAATIVACSEDYDLLCPHCKLEGKGDVHLVLLPDDSGFQCAGAGHQYRTGEILPIIGSYG